jgi:hypothetical protein
MTQIVLNVETPALARLIRSLVKNMTGVHIVSSKKKKKTGYELAMEDVKNGRVEEYSSVKELFDSIEE